MIFTLLTIQFTLQLLLQKKYDENFFYFVSADLLVINCVFLFTLLKFRSISQNNKININKRMMCLHLVLLIMLIFSFTWKFCFFDLSYGLDM